MEPAAERGKGQWITDYRSAASEIRRNSKRSKTRAHADRKSRCQQNYCTLHDYNVEAKSTQTPASLPLCAQTRGKVPISRPSPGPRQREGCAVSGHSPCRSGSEMTDPQARFVAAHRIAELRAKRSSAPDRSGRRLAHVNSWSSRFASFRSAVSKPSVNQA